MPSFIQNFINKVRSLWEGSSLANRILVIGVTLSVILVFILLLVWLNKPQYKVLYSRMYPEDAGSVVELLKKEKVDYKLEDNGSTILVPAGKVYDLRLKVAGEGYLHGQGVGFEIFDESKIGQTDFVQHINYQRALQGELARTIAEFPAIERARVHLVLPNKSLFIEEQNDPSASVMVRLKGGGKLAAKQVQSIVNLVSTSVEGLEGDRITITDTSGRLLYEPRGEESLAGLTSNQLEYKNAFERRLQQNIEQVLLPVVGSGKVIARVNADLDFSRKTIHKEIYDPDSAVVRSEQSSDEETRGSTQLEAGVPEPAFEGPQGAGQTTSQQTTRTSSTVNFEINKEEQQIIAPVGALQRLSVAVLVDGKYEPGAEGAPVFVPRSDEEMTRIQELAKKAVGFDAERGDAIEATSIAFKEGDVLAEPGIMDTILEYAKMLAKPLLNAVLIILFLLLIIRPLVLALLKPKVAGRGAAGTRGLPRTEGRMALGEGEDREEMEAMAAKRRIDDYKQHAKELMDKNRPQAVAVVKNWLKEGEA